MTANQKQLDLRREKAAAMRYRRPALAELGYDFVQDGLSEIGEECDNIRYYLESDDGSDGGFLHAVDGDSDLSEEFRMAFCDIAGTAEQLYDALNDYGCEIDSQTFDDCTCALIGNRYSMVGFDDFEEDYYSLCRYDSERAISEAGERLMRKTKKDMIATIGQCVGIAMAYQDLRLKFEYLKAAMEVQMGINLDLLKVATEVNEAWENEDWRKLERLAAGLPERVWVE